MASAKKVRRQKILKIFLLECSCRSVESCCAVARANSRLSKRNVFCPDELSYGELSAPMRYNVFRLHVVGVLEHSTVYTDKRLFKDTKLFITSNAPITCRWCYSVVGAHPALATGYASAYIFFVCVIAGEESSSPNVFLILSPF